MIKTANGGRAAVGTDFDMNSTTHAERNLIMEREARVAEWRKSLPKRRKPEHEKAGPISWITF